MAGLQDLLLIRQLQDQRNPFKILAASVGEGIEIGRAEQKAKKKLAEANELAINKFQSGNTNRDNMIDKLTLRPDGSYEYSAVSESTSQEATRIKTQRENRVASEQASLIKDFNTTGSNITVTDLINSGIKPADASKMEALRVPIGATVDGIRAAHESIVSDNLISQASVQPGGGTVIQSGPVVTQDFDAVGRPKGSTDIGIKSAIETAAADVQVGKEVKSQRAKAGELAQRGTQRAASASGTAMSEVVRFNVENLEKFGFKPGAGFGFVERLLPEQLNKYKAAAVGAGREAAATVGTQIIPAARAVRMVEIFAKSTAEIGNTVEGNAANTGASLSNVWGNALSSNFDIELNDGSKVPIKTQVKDPLTGKALSDIPFPEILMAMQRATNEFKLLTEEQYLQDAYNIEPRILQDSTRQRISEDRRIKRINELRSRR